MMDISTLMLTTHTWYGMLEKLVETKMPFNVDDVGYASAAASDINGQDHINSYWCINQY